MIGFSPTAHQQSVLEFFGEYGFVVFNDFFTDDQMGSAFEACLLEQEETAGERSVLQDSGSWVNFVTSMENVPPVAALTDDLLLRRWARILLGVSDVWLFEHPFGVVYQDARLGDGSGYSRIGWHRDCEAYDVDELWPAVAFTIHFDPTGPANGFLRVVPGSHELPDGPKENAHGRVNYEEGLYLEMGDVLFHHSSLWHAAARATADGQDSVRRHLRGSFHPGERTVNLTEDLFNRNAAR